MKFLKNRLTLITALLFSALIVLGLFLKNGWGTPSSFGWETVAAICPLGSIEILAAGGNWNSRTAIAFGLLVLVVFAFGRFFCGWLCPVPLLARIRLWFAKLSAPAPQTASEKSRTIPIVAEKSKKHEPNPKAPLAILAATIGSSWLFGFPVFCLICPVGITFALVLALASFFLTGDISTGLGYFAVVLIIEIFVLKRWCHSFCPVGALMSLISRINVFFRPRINRPTCLKLSRGIACSHCHDACPEGIDLTKPISTAILSRCTKCHACAVACPTGSISFPSIPTDKDTTGRSPDRPRVKVPQSSAVERTKNFAQVEQPLSREAAVIEAQRCLRCGKCSEACPQGNPIAQWMELMADGRMKAAGRAILTNGGMSEACSRICPREKLCEGICPLNETSGAVAIGALIRHAADSTLKEGYTPPHRRTLSKKKRVAVVGSGPSGLTFAEMLAREGANVTVYEKDMSPGGLLTDGIPSFKLDKSHITERLTILEHLGVKIKTNCEVGRNVPVSEIAAYNAVYLATGAQKPVMLNVPGASGSDVFEALWYLRNEQRTKTLLHGKSVLILGAGGTAVDAARTAIREGATSAALVVRRTPEAIKAPKADVVYAKEEGVQFIFERECTAVIRDGNRVTGITVKRAEGGEETLKCDAVIHAFGFSPDPQPWEHELGVTFDECGRIIVTGHVTANPKVFAGGDCVRGASLATYGAADGRAATHEVMLFLGLEKAPRVPHIRRL